MLTLTYGPRYLRYFVGARTRGEQDEHGYNMDLKTGGGACHFPVSMNNIRITSALLFDARLIVPLAPETQDPRPSANLLN